MQKTDLSIEAYIDSLDPKHQPTIQALVDMVYQANPDIAYSAWQGIFWGGSEQTILGFGEYTYENAAGVKGSWFKVGVTRQKAYYALHIAVVKNGEYLVKKYKERLGKVKGGAAAINFTKLENVDTDVLKELLIDALND